MYDEIGFSADDLQELQNLNASIVSPTEEILSSWGKHELGVSKTELMSTYIIENFDSSEENISWAFTRKENNAERARYLHFRDNMYDLGYCAKNYSARFETATAMAFISCIRLIFSGLQNQWDLANLTNQGHGSHQYDQAYFPRMGNLTAVSDVPTLQRNGFLPRSWCCTENVAV